MRISPASSPPESALQAKPWHRQPPLSPVGLSRRQLASVLLLPALAALAGPLAAAELPPVRLAYFDAYAPFSFRTPDGAMTGVEVEALDLVLGQRLGRRLIHVGCPWARAQALVESGEADGFCTAPTPERERYARFSRSPLFISPSVVVYHPRGPAAAVLAAAATRTDLQGFTHVNYLGNAFIERLFGHDAVLWVRTPEMALQMIERGRADYMVWAEQTARYEMRRLGLDTELAWHAIDPGAVAAYHFGLRRGYPDGEALLAGVDDALEDAGILEDIAAILRRYA